ncbi:MULTISPECIES: hypothetical protein [Streptomyces]|uniref:Uncharacterized protein n=1 Tax=Streptomyces dengpaensis TaxID=2049881 RepID=A0ABN5IBT7_9ACTN|nr:MULTISPECIES: hypothetical protein [Streptomyces]AVH60664.1 hypothetical protein C4B68_38395 [Streptomyces dengpaensis]PIB03535.1 hypothetical protein B1C81_36690 [Streptomyces sp. HG99]
MTLRLLDEAGTRHSYVIKDATDASNARTAVRQIANTPAEQTARGGTAIDPEYADVLELTEHVLSNALRLDGRAHT